MITYPSDSLPQKRGKRGKIGKVNNKYSCKQRYGAGTAVKNVHDIECTRKTYRFRSKGGTKYR